MIEQIIKINDPLPFLYKNIDSVIIANNSIVLDLFYLNNINGLILKNYKVFNENPTNSFKEIIEVKNKQNLLELKNFNMTEGFLNLLSNLLMELNSNLIGIQVTEPTNEMCPNVHIDKLPLRLVQCLDGPGTTVFTSKNDTINTEQKDLVFMKGQTWKTTVGPLKHKSPKSNGPRRLVRVDILN